MAMSKGAQSKEGVYGSWSIRCPKENATLQERMSTAQKKAMHRQKRSPNKFESLNIIVANTRSPGYMSQKIPFSTFATLI